MAIRAHTTNTVNENDDIIIADTDGGGVRIGIKGTIWFDFPAGHAEYSKIKLASLEEAEVLLDEYCGSYFANGIPGFTDFHSAHRKKR